ncbi:hypothetical protein MMPV_007061 [Pyropia vietnamensis]
MNQPTSPHLSPADTPKKKGENLGWSPDELLALMESALLVLEDPAIGNAQTAAKLGARIRVRFIERAPEGSGTMPGCEARTGKFAKAAELTGNLSEVETGRCVLACYNAQQSGKGMSSRANHLPTITRDPFYAIGEPFEYYQCNLHLSNYTTLLTTAGVTTMSTDRSELRGGVGNGRVAGSSQGGTEGDAVTQEHRDVFSGTITMREERPLSVKAARNARALKRTREGERAVVDEEAAEVVARLGGIDHVIEREAKNKHQRHEDNLRVQADKLALAAFNALYNGIELTLTERIKALDDLRKQYRRKTLNSSHGSATGSTDERSGRAGGTNAGC